MLPALPTLPGLPDWLSIILLLAALAFGLAFLLMPFAVFGVKTRLEAIEQRLAETEDTLRALARQVAAQPGFSRATDIDDAPLGPLARPRTRKPDQVRAGQPPVPPPPVVPEARIDSRAEPRIDWPRNA